MAGYGASMRAGKVGGYGKAGGDAGWRGSPYAGKGGKPPPEPNTNLYVTGLPQTCDDKYIREVFGQHGTVVDCKVLQPRSEKQTRHALIRFSTLEEAIAVKEGQEGYFFPGSDVAMTIDYAKAGARDQGLDWQRHSMQVMEQLSKTGGAFGSPPPFIAGGGCQETVVKKGGKGGWGKGELLIGNRGKGKVCSGGNQLDDASSMSKVLKGFLHVQWIPGQDLINDDNAVSLIGLPADCQDVHLYRLLSPFGPIAPNGLKLLTWPDGSCRGSGSVLFMDPASALAAAELLHGLVMPDGNTLRATVKKPKSSDEAPFLAPWGVVGAGFGGDSFAGCGGSPDFGSLV